MSDSWLAPLQGKSRKTRVRGSQGAHGEAWGTPGILGKVLPPGVGIIWGPIILSYILSCSPFHTESKGAFLTFLQAQEGRVGERGFPQRREDAGWALGGFAAADFAIVSISQRSPGSL